MFSGLGGSNSSSQLNYGTISSYINDFGWNTQQYVADGNPHTVVVEASYTTNTITLTLDGVNLGYLNVAYTINSTYLALGCSYPYVAVYAEFDLYSFAMEINGALAVEYQQFTASELSAGVLDDGSGNSNNGTLHGSFSLTGDNASVTPTLFVTNTSAIAITTPKVFVTTIPWSASITTSFDTARNVIKEETILADTLREVTDGVSTVVVEADTARNVIKEYTLDFDTSREVKTYTFLYFSTLRAVINPDKQQKSMGHDVLTLAPKTQVDSITDFNSVVNFDFNGGINTSGEYQIPVSHRIYNENDVLACVDIDIDAEAYNVNQWLDLAINFDSIQDFDGEDISSFISVTPYMRTFIEGSGYGNWQRIISGAQYKGIYFDFKLELSTTDENTTVLVRNFKYTVRAS